MWYRNRRYRRRMRGIPFVLPLIILLSSHSLGAFIASLIFAAILFFIIRAVMASQSGVASMGMGGYQQQPYQQPYQSPYQQPYQQPYQAPYQQPYQAPYQQGYRAPQEAYQGGEQQYPYPLQSQYEQYEQPQAQYPEQMPPMQG